MKERHHAVGPPQQNQRININTYILGIYSTASYIFYIYLSKYYTALSLSKLMKHVVQQKHNTVYIRKVYQYSGVLGIWRICLMTNTLYDHRSIMLLLCLRRIIQHPSTWQLSGNGVSFSRQQPTHFAELVSDHFDTFFLVFLIICFLYGFFFSFFVFDNKAFPYNCFLLQTAIWNGLWS